MSPDSTKCLLGAKFLPAEKQFLPVAENPVQTDYSAKEAYGFTR